MEARVHGGCLLICVGLLIVQYRLLRKPDRTHSEYIWDLLALTWWYGMGLWHLLNLIGMMFSWQ